MDTEQSKIEQYAAHILAELGFTVVLCRMDKGGGYLYARFLRQTHDELEEVKAKLLSDNRIRVHSCGYYPKDSPYFVAWFSVFNQKSKENGQ